MGFATGFDLDEVHLLLTLSNLAYQDEKPLPLESMAHHQARMEADIDRQLQSSRHSDWTVAWGPALTDDLSNMMFAAQNSSGGQCVVVIRGTSWDYIEDWLQDLAVLTLVPYKIGTAPGDCQVAFGTWSGLQTLMGMRAADGTTLNDFVKGRVDAGADIFVTGHSLGGCLASVVAPWLASEHGAGHFKVYTFAAPSAGNQAFADYYNQLFIDANGNSTAFRVFNSLDAVPNAWQTLTTIKGYYPSPGPACTPELSSVIDLAIAAGAGNYRQVGTAPDSARELQGTAFAEGGSRLLSVLDDKAFVAEVGLQHSPDTYMQLLFPSAAPS